MARDDRIRMRNGLVIPGVLLIFYGLLAIVYAEMFRARSDFCADSNRILIAGLCYSVRNLIIPLVVIGIALIITGLVAFKAKPNTLQGHLHHGTPTHVVLSLLISWVAAAAIGWIVQTVRQGGGEPFELTVLGSRFQHTFLLELLFLVGLVILVPYLSLYIGNGLRRRRFLEAASKALDEPDRLPHEPGYDFHDTAAASEAQAVNMVPDEDWPAGRGDKDPAPVPVSELDEAAPEAEAPPTPPSSSSIIGCTAKADGRSCPNPVRDGTRYCEAHGCSGITKDGQPCRNAAADDGLCPVHLAAERQA